MWLGGVSDPSMTVYPPRAFNNFAQQRPDPTRVSSPDNGFRSGNDTSDGDHTISDDGLSPWETDGPKSNTAESKPNVSATDDNAEHVFPTPYPPPPYTDERHNPHHNPHEAPKFETNNPSKDTQQNSQTPRPRAKSTPPSSSHTRNSNTQPPPRPTTPHEYHKAQAGKHNHRSYKPECYEYIPIYHPIHCPGHTFVYPKSWPSEAAFDAWHEKQKLVYDLWKKGAHETYRAQENHHTAGGGTCSQQHNNTYSWQAPQAPPQPTQNSHGQFHQPNTHRPWRQQTYPGSRFQSNFAPDYTREHGNQGAPPSYQFPPKPAPATPTPPPKMRTRLRSYVPPGFYPSTTKSKTTQTIRDAFLAYDEQWDMLIAPNDGNKLTFFSVPWPQFPRPSSVEDINTQMIRKFLACSGISMKVIVRKALLRFHPDKIANLIANVEDEYKEDVSDGCAVVARCLSEIKSSL